MLTPALAAGQSFGPRLQIPNSDAPITDAPAGTVHIESDDGHRLLQVGLFLSSIVDMQFTSPESNDNGFAIEAARLALIGDMASNFSYLLQLDAAAPEHLVDARITYHPSDLLRIQVGRFKVPVSGEFLAPIADVDLIRRALVVRALAPGRQVGAEIGGATASRGLFWRGGVFNGNRQLVNDDDNFLVAARVGHLRPLAGARLALAVNGAYSYDRIIRIPLDPLQLDPELQPAFSGRRILVGGDGRATWGPAHVATEWLYSRLHTDSGEIVNVWGGHATVGSYVTRGVQLLARWQSLRTDGLTRSYDLLTPSVFVAPVPDVPLGTQLDFTIDTRDFDRTQIMANAYVAY